MTSPLSAATVAIIIEDLKEWLGKDVLNAEDDKLGKLEEVLYDIEADVPAFAAVKSGVFGKHVTLVPLSGATAGREYVRVTATKEQFKDAPSFEPGVELSVEDEAAAYRHYGLDYRSAGQGVRRLAKH
jgi:hypothetical protein